MWASVERSLSLALVRSCLDGVVAVVGVEILHLLDFQNILSTKRMENMTHEECNRWQHRTSYHEAETTANRTIVDLLPEHSEEMDLGAMLERHVMDVFSGYVHVSKKSMHLSVFAFHLEGVAALAACSPAVEH